jgi:predicted transcriptional regulator
VESATSNSKPNPRANTTSKKYKQQVEWRINKARELLARGYSQSKISSELRVSQSTISKDLNLVRNQFKGGLCTDEKNASEKYIDLSLAIRELVQNLWKIIDDARTNPKLRLKAHSMMIDYYQLETQLSVEISRLDKNNEKSNEKAEPKEDFVKITEANTPVWTKRMLEKRLKYHTQIGIVAEHFEMIGMLKNVQRILFRALNDESSKPSSDRNLIGVCRLSSSILQNTLTLRQLNVDTPFVDRMKKEIDKAREIKKSNDKKSQVCKPFDPKDYPPSALVIDPNSIAGKPVDIVDDNDDPVVE